MNQLNVIEKKDQRVMTTAQLAEAFGTETKVISYNFNYNKQRYEEGKHAEIFTLVIKSTMEEGWFETSSAGKEYIEITELELDEILNGKESENLVREAKEVGMMFRF